MVELHEDVSFLESDFSKCSPSVCEHFMFPDKKILFCFPKSQVSVKREFAIFSSHLSETSVNDQYNAVPVQGTGVL